MAGPIRIAILANGRQARAEIQRTAGSADLMGKSVARVAKLVAAGFAVDRLVRAAAAVVKVGGEYVTTLNKIEAVTGASQRQIDLGASTLEAQARQFAAMGQTTGDAAAGTLELAKAGLSLDKSLKAVYPTMILAKAGQLEVADASTLVANTLNTFNLKASEAEHIANSLANAANASSSDVSDLAESFKYVAPLAAKSGVTLDQTNAILAELSNSGIKASQAGTGLRKFLASLQAPAGAAKQALADMNVEVFDAQGKMRPLGPIIDDLQAGLSKLTDKGQAKALRDVFGLQGITPAQVILKEGTKGLDKYVKAVERAGGAAELAKASSKGLAGTLSSLRAATISEADALYRKYSPAVDKGLQTLIKSAKAELPDALDKARSVLHELIPVLESLADLAVDVGGDVKDLATGPIGDDLVGALKLLVGLTKEVADFLGSIPDPIRKIGVEAGLAALVLPRLTASVASTTASLQAQIVTLKQWRAEMTYGVTRTQNLAAATARLQSAAKTAAGVGGMLALVDGAQRSDSALGRLELAAGGAAAGFSLAGPWGALIGGAAGGLIPALHDLVGRTDDVAGSMRAAKPEVRDFASTLDEVSAAATTATRKVALMALQERGSIEQGLALGLNQRTLIDATLGRKDALAQVQAAIDQYTNSEVLANSAAEAAAAAQGGFRPVYDKQSEAIQKQAAAAAGLANSLGVLTPQLRQQARETRTNAIVTQDLTALFPKLRKGAVAKIKTLGTEASIKQVLELNKRLKLTPKELRTLLRVTGAVDSERQAKRVVAQLDNINKVKVNPDIGGGVKKSGKAAASAAEAIRLNVERGLNKIKANLPELQPSLRRATGSAAGVARSGAAGIGSSVKSGFGSGFAGADGLWASEVREAVNAAIAAGRAAAKAHSPSEETARLGRDMADGLLVGLRSRKEKYHVVGQAVVRDILGGITEGADGIEKVLDRIEKLIREKITGKGDEKRENALLKSLRKQEQALKANGRAQDQLNKKFEAARDALKDLQAQASAYAAAIQQTFIETGNLANLGQDDQGNVSLSKLLADLRDKVARAQQFAALINQLRTQGLNQTSLQQLLDAGPDAALGAASAIASGGQAAVDEINALAAQLAAVGGGLGASVSDSMYGAGLAAAQGLVDGLADSQKDLEKIARKLGQALIDAVKKQLQSHSPSRVFMNIGHDTTAGLLQALSADQIYVKRAGAGLADSLAAGYQSRPALTTFLSGGSASSRQTFDVRLSAEDANTLLLGGKVRMVLDAYDYAAGI